MWEELKKQVECINNGGVIDPTYSEPASKEELKERAIYMFHDHGASYLAHQAKSKAESAAILEKMQRRNDEREQQSKILGVVLAGIVGAKNIAIQNKQAQIQKKNEILATQQAQVQAQQAQSAANAKQLAEYDRQYVKHDTPGSQNQSSGNYGASSDNSNSSNTNQQARPHKERVNLPSQTGCINMGKSNKQDPTSDTRWFLLKNGCAYPVHVTWCNGQGCVNSSFASDIPSGGADEVWAKKDNDGKIHLNLMACQESSGSDEVFTDWPHKQCYADVEMN